MGHGHGDDVTLLVHGCWSTRFGRDWIEDAPGFARRSAESSAEVMEWIAWHWEEEMWRLDVKTYSNEEEMDDDVLMFLSKLN